MWLDTFDGKIPQPAILKPKPLWTGKQLFSLILQGCCPQVNAMTFMSAHDEKTDPDWNSIADTRVIIEQGNLICGILCKKTLGTSEGSLVHLVMREHGFEATRNFLDQTQKVGKHPEMNSGLADPLFSW